MNHHAFVIEAGVEEGIEVAEAWLMRELKMEARAPSTKLGAGNPDIIVLRFSLFSVDDARKVFDSALQAPFRGPHKAIIIAASRAYHEAQNALLKLFEEPPPGTYLFLVLPSLGGLLPTLRSRIQILNTNDGFTKPLIAESAETFLKASKEKRSAIIKKLASGKDDEERRENRDEAIAIVNSIEAIAYQDLTSGRTTSRHQHQELLGEIQTLRGYLHDRSAPVRMILEHLSLVLPEGLRGKG